MLYYYLLKKQHNIEGFLSTGNKYSKSLNNVVLFNVILLWHWWEKNWFPAGATVGAHVLSMSAWVFSRDSGFPPRPKDVHEKWTLNCPSQSVGVWSCPAMAVLSRMGAHLGPELPGGSSHWQPWTRSSGLENNDLCFYSSFLNVSIAHIYFSVSYKHFGSLVRSLVIFLWPEICHRSLTSVYIH